MTPWILDVEPLTMPPLVGVIGGVCGAGDRWLRPLLQGKPPNRCDSGRLPLGQGLPAKNPLEEVHVQLHPEEGLIDSDEPGDVQYPSRVEVLQLQAPLIEEAAQGPVHGIPEPMLMEGKEGDDLVGLGLQEPSNVPPP